MTMRSRHTRLTPGDRLDRFTIHGLLAQGENSEIYRAFHPAFKRDVAIKVFHPDITRTESLTPVFINQTKDVIALRHPNIMRILEAGVAGDSYYLVMELVVGMPLRDDVSAHPRGFERDAALRLFRPIASAVAYAHDQDIMHGSIKPDNVLIDQTHKPILTDFNIPCFREHPSGRGGAANPAYLAPEQAAQNLITVQSDIYALGILLYELITGDVPFKSKTRKDIIEEHRLNDPVPPSKIRVDLDPRIENTIMHAIKRDPAERFVSVRDMLVSLDSEAAANPFETLHLTRDDMTTVQKRKAEIRQFERSRIATTSTEESRVQNINPRVMVVAGVVIVALIAVLFVVSLVV